MKLISINCPNCGGTIDIDPDNISRFCKNCGSKVMLDVDAIQNLLMEKEKTKQESIQAEEKKRIAELNALTKLSTEKSERTKLIVGAIIGSVGLIAAMIALLAD